MNNIEFNTPIKYKTLCEMFDEEVKVGGRNKNLQIKRWQKEYEIIKNGMYYKIIRELSDEEKQKKNFICYKNENHHIRDKEKYEQFDVAEINRHSSGIYKIELDNNIYIGQTNDFYNRFRHHYYSSFPTHDLLKNGAVFSIVELENDREKRLQKESAYIKQYVNDDKYVCVNKDFNNEIQTYKKKYLKLKFDYVDKDKIIEILNKEGIKYESI